MLVVPTVLSVGSEAAVGAAPAFCMDRTEVTVADYWGCVERGACTPPASDVWWPNLPAADQQFWSESCTGDREDRLDHPINCVDWRQARDYCADLGRRLPTEVEWQWAAQGGREERAYPWGDGRPTARVVNACEFDCLDRMREHGRDRPTLHYGEDGRAETAPTGSYPAGKGRWGHDDLAGNVWEFTTSIFADDEDVKVMRGGGWAQSQRNLIGTRYRAAFPSGARASVVGFRCVQAPTGAMGTLMAGGR